MNLKEQTTRIKQIMGLNEAAISPNTDNIKVFYDELLDNFNEDTIDYKLFRDIGKKHNIDILSLDEFKENPPENFTSRMPTDSMMEAHIKTFGYVTPDTNRITLVFPNRLMSIHRTSLPRILQVLKHENIHLQQSFRRPSEKTGEYFGDVNNSKEYFKNKDEVMAFAHTIIDQFIQQYRPNNFEEATSQLNTFLKKGYNPIWGTIKRSVDDKTLKRYIKYLYQYLEIEFDNR